MRKRRLSDIKTWWICYEENYEGKKIFVPYKKLGIGTDIKKLMNVKNLEEF